MPYTVIGLSKINKTCIKLVVALLFTCVFIDKCFQTKNMICYSAAF